MNYSDISDDIYYNDDFSYLENIDSNEKDKSNLDFQILCDVDNLYNKAMKKDSNNYNKLQNENNRKIEEDINKMFSYNKNYYNQLIDQYKRDVTISLPQKNIDILNSVYRTKYDVGILNNVQFGENVTCNEEQLKAIRNCSGACSRNECNYENMQVVLGYCRINGIPQSYGETFCIEEQDNCLSIQKQYIENCSKDCYSCDGVTSDITLGGCLINNISQVYGDTFCSDNNVNICSPEQIDYYERCKENCNSCNRITADTFMSNCTIDGKRPIHSHNYCINCNLYNSGDPTTCVSLKSLDNSITCKYTHPGIDEIPASCKLLNNPNSSDYEGFVGTKDSCPEDKNYYFIPGTHMSTINRNESCSETINCDGYTSGDPYSCVSIESTAERCVYNIPSTNINEATPRCINSENEDYYNISCDNVDFSGATTSDEYVSHLNSLELETNVVTLKTNYANKCGVCTSKSVDELSGDGGPGFVVEIGDEIIGQPHMWVNLQPNNIITITPGPSVPEGWFENLNVYQDSAENYPNVIFASRTDYEQFINNPGGGELGIPRTCREIYDHSLGYCPPEFCNYNSQSCPENEGYKYIYGRSLEESSNNEMCLLKNKIN